MEITKENIKINSYLIGLHSFFKDHNYGNYKANLINDIQSLFNSNFDTFKIGGVDILKFAPEGIFEIRLTPSTIIYQDEQSFEKITDNAKKILAIWLNHSPKTKLSLIGLVTNFEIVKIDRPIGNSQLHIKNQFFKEFNLGHKLKGGDFHFTYSINYHSYEYNVHISLSEKKEKEYSLTGNVDFNETTENKINGLDKNNCDRIFSSAKQYFEEDFIKIINMRN